jgi:hypothetical protein
MDSQCSGLHHWHVILAHCQCVFGMLSIALMARFRTDVCDVCFFSRMCTVLGVCFCMYHQYLGGDVHNLLVCRSDTSRFLGLKVLATRHGWNHTQCPPDFGMLNIGFEFVHNIEVLRLGVCLCCFPLVVHSCNSSSCSRRSAFSTMPCVQCGRWAAQPQWCAIL